MSFHKITVESSSLSTCIFVSICLRTRPLIKFPKCRVWKCSRIRNLRFKIFLNWLSFQFLQLSLDFFFFSFVASFLLSFDWSRFDKWILSDSRSFSVIELFFLTSILRLFISGNFKADWSLVLLRRIFIFNRDF